MTTGTEARLRVAVCGAGTMGAAIAQLAASSGADVAVVDLNPAVLEAARQRTEASLRSLESKGRLCVPAGEIQARLSWLAQIDAMGPRDLVIEAIVENVEIKRALFNTIERVAGVDAVIVSNTSSLPIALLGRDLVRPDRFLGMHFFNPATIMKLVEVVPTAVTDPQVASFVEDIARDWGKIAVRVADVPGFIVNRIGRPYHGEGFRAMQEGIAPTLVDHLFRAGAGFRMGPLELADLIGQDINFGTTRSIFDAYFGAVRFVPQRIQASLIDGGLLGRKTGQGVFEYRDGAPAALPPAPHSETVAPIRSCHEIALGAILIDEPDMTIRVTRGDTAAEETRQAGRLVAVVDWCAASGSAIGFAATDAIAGIAADRIAALGITPYRLPDRPGLVVARTAAQIANGAMDAILECVADADGVDAAMKFGANYPFGPVEWAREQGVSTVAAMLARIAHHTGAAMYLPSEQWSRL